MAKVNIGQRAINIIFGAILGFLGWFIRLVTFIGDVTIWILKTAIFSLVLVIRKILRLDLTRIKVLSKINKFLHLPVIYRDLSFKIGLLTIALMILFTWFITKDLPSPKQLESREIFQTTKIQNRNGKLLFDVYTDQNRTIVPLTEIGDNLKNATIAIEDKDFYKHRGFDVWGIIRAATKTAGGSLQGGSTITQQLVKSVFLTPERTLDRKLKELYLAFRVEMAYPKDKILEMYLNQVPYGGTAWGIEAASEQYFGKRAHDLNLAESALLAGLPAAPSYFSPFAQNPQRAKDRQKLVLERMVAEHYISQEDADRAANEELKYTESATNIKAPHFVFWVKELLAAKYGVGVAEQGGLRVTTSLDLDLQEKAQNIVAENIAKLKPLNASNGAAIVTNPKTGEVLSMVGSRNFFDKDIDGNVNVTLANRQPGSSIKPINYATAIEHKLITPATIILDVPTTFGGAGTPPYKPVNYDGRFHGAVTVRNALGNSFNIPAVKVLALNGVDKMIEQSRAMGITTFEDPSRYGLSLTLGGGEVKMTDMATAFGVFANAGERIDLVPILKVEDSNGRVIEQYQPKVGKRVLSAQTAFLMSSMLSDNGARSAAFGSSSLLNIKGKNVAVKTGTTDDKRDNWTIGYTPSFLVASWVGNNDNTPMNPALASGVTGAAPIWNQIMIEALKNKINETFKVPTGVIGMEYCSSTGGAKSEGCQNRFEYFIAGTEPKKNTFTKSKVWIDKSTGQVVAPGAENAEEQEQIIVNDFYSKKDYCAFCPQIAPPPSPTPSPH